MIEEEIIKEVKGYLDFEEGISIRAIQGLLDLYEKEKMNSSNLSEQLNKEKEKNKSIVYNYEMVVDKLENTIRKDKIKAKIKEYNKQRQETGNSIIYTRMVDYMDCLNELLEESE